MRINSHAHIFNLRAVFTPATQATIVNRFARKNWPPYVMEALKEVVNRVVTGENLDEQRLLEAFVRRVGVSEQFNDLIKSLNGAIPADLQVVASGNVSGLAVDFLHDLVRKLGDQITENDDADNETLSDVIAFLLVGIKHTIAEVTDELVRQTPSNTLLVALTLDITDATTDDTQWKKQLADTADAALAYPGLVLPFVCVNPARKAHFDLMEKALTLDGFIGVKLYPSLGYDTGLDTLGHVYEYCVANDVPLLLHCNDGGFKRDDDTADFCNPVRWDPVFKKYPDLRVCFGHFGGDRHLATTKFTAAHWQKPDAKLSADDPLNFEANWALKILSLMERYENVYADISYHTDPMAGGAKEEAYFHNLIQVILQSPKTRSRVLFGSDYFLVRQRLSDANMWRYFEPKFSEADWVQITDTNPRAFLGMPADDGTGGRRNIRRHVNWLIKHANDVERLPAAWAQKAADVASGQAVTFSATPLGPKWSVNNQAHVAVWKYLVSTQFLTADRNLTFTQAGTVPLRRLDYWVGDRGGGDIALNQRRGLAGSLNKALKSVGVGYEPNVSEAGAVDQIVEALADGDLVLYEFAAKVDALYRFPQENLAV